MRSCFVGRTFVDRRQTVRPLLDGGFRIKPTNGVAVRCNAPILSRSPSHFSMSSAAGACCGISHAVLTLPRVDATHLCQGVHLLRNGMIDVGENNFLHCKQFPRTVWLDITKMGY